jgi:YidC/Oxa1 family membrane protein insertase
MIAFFKTIIYIPLYNILVAILNIHWIDAGMAAVILTVLVKFILYPLAKKSTVTQIKMKEKEKELNSIKEKYKDKQEQALKVMEFYKMNKINPFSGILTILIQIPIIYSLYFIFLKSGLPKIDTSLLYPFIKAPASVSVNFLGFLDVSQKSLILALLAAITTFLQMHLSPSLADKEKKNISQAKSAEDFSKIMGRQMKFTLPLVVFFIAWQISGVVALYWLVSNLCSILQDWYVKRQLVKANLISNS